MRLTLVLSLAVAAFLAGLAVYVARDWLANERLMLRAEIESPDRDAAPVLTILVASEEISFGERLIPNKVRAIEWTGSIVPDNTFATVEELIPNDDEDSARFALTSMAVGEPILSTKITDPGVRAKLSTALTPGLKAISIRVNDVLGVAGFVLPGDRVDVLITRSDDAGSYVDVLLQGVKVLAIDQIADARKDQPSVVRTVTFEVNTKEAQKLVLGGSVGTLSLALRNLASTIVEPNDRIRLQDLTDLDVAEDLIPQITQPEAEPDNTANLEEMLQRISDGLTDRIDSVERKMAEPAPLTAEPEKVEKVVAPALLPLDLKSTVGVIRNGRRDEYKVNNSARESDADETGTLREATTGTPEPITQTN